MSNLIQLRKERVKLSKQLEELYRSDEKYEEVYSQLCVIAENIRKIENERWANTLRVGLQPFYNFIHSNFDVEKFTPTLYRMLASCFGNIAHYDRQGFYNALFATDDQVIKTLESFLTFSRNNPNDCLFKLEEEIQEMISESHILFKLKQKKVEDTINREKAELKRLLDKYHCGELPDDYHRK